MKLSGYAFVASALLLSTVSVRAEDLQSEINKLREDVIVLQRQVYRGIETENKAVGSANADIQVKMSDYADNFRTMNGRIDELEYKIKQLDEQLTKMNRDFEIRFKILEGKQIPASLSAPAPNLPTVYDAPVAQGAAKAVVGDSIQGSDLAPIAGSNTVVTTGFLNTAADDGTPQALVPLPTAATTEAVKPISVKEMYDTGLEAFNQGYYDEAEVAFKHILEQSPKDILAGNAQYWLGEVYYRRGDFNAAKQAFKTGYVNYHDGYKAADSLFKLGMTFESLKDNKNACVVFSSFGDEFPKAGAELAKRVKTEATKLGCK
jgi:tol-pal system protein YbgF